MSILNHIIKKNLYIICILVSCLSFAQNKDAKSQEILTLIARANKAHFEFKNVEALKFAKKANVMALQSGNSKLIAATYEQMAIALTNLGMQKESLTYIEKALAENYSKNDEVFQVKLRMQKANNHSILGLFDLANEEYFKALNLLDKKKGDSAAMLNKVNVLTLITNNFFNFEKDYQSAMKYENQKHEILKKFPEKKVMYFLSVEYDTKGYIYLETNKLDSALHYFNKGYALKQKYGDEVLFSQYCAFADYYARIGDQKKALEYYLKTIENLEKLGVQDPAYTAVYKDTSEIYGEMGDKEKENYYLKKYSELNNKIHQATTEDASEAIKMILGEKDEKFNAFQNKSFLTIGGIVTGTAALIFGLFVWYRKSSKKTEEIISQKEEENQNLQLKVNESFDEVVLLAKNNSPEFWARFQEVYPNFQEKLLKVNPQIRTSELTFCAYLFLGFSTKEIADYTFKAVKTIENNRYNIRKKLGLSPEKDLQVWLREQIESE